MDRIRLLDCTLRDGGYINDWKFGEEPIHDMIDKLEKTNVDILEIGFIKDEPYQRDRTVFNDMGQIETMISPKKPSLQYAAMIEVVNPIPLEKLVPRTKNAVDIIRVIVWKTKHAGGQVVDALEEGFAYCKGIVEKGYKLCVQPARVDQYSDEEFVAMVRRFSTLDPLAIYVVDSWGTQNPEQLLYYMHLADDNMPRQIALGYHGHNNMMQALSAAQQMIHEGFDREIIIDASIYGIGRGAGNLNLELIASYLNQCYGKSYNISDIPFLYDEYLKNVYLSRPWGYRPAYYLTAIHNCNPNYGEFYDLDLHLPPDTIESILVSLPHEDRAMYSSEKAYKYSKAFFCRKWKNKLCIIYPTANRSEDIEYCLKSKADQYAYFGIDCIIYDSSDDDKTEKIVAHYSKAKESTIKYVRYTGKFDGISLDDKVINAYRDFSNQYEYIWVCRDGYVINFAQIAAQLDKILKKKPDAVVLYHYAQNEMGLPEVKEYTDPNEILAYHAKHMSILGCTLVSSEFIQSIIQNYPIHPIKNYGLWQPMTFFEHWATCKPYVISIVGEWVEQNANATPSSFWNKKGKALWQWGKRWCEMVDALPSCYDTEKEKIIHIGMVDFTPFAPKQLLIMRANGSLTLKHYRAYKSYLDRVTKTPAWQFYTASCIPKWALHLYLNNKERLLAKLMKQCFYGIKWVYKKIKNEKTLPVDKVTFQKYYNLIGKTEIKKIDLLNDVRFKNGQIVIIIPTANRMDIIEAQYESIFKMYSEYGIDIVVWDSSDNTDVQKAVKSLNEQYSLSVKWEKYNGKYDEQSIDAKVISAYEAYCDKYEYLWIIRDRMAVNFNECAIALLAAMKKKNDMIIVQNRCDDYHHVGNKKYDDCIKLYKELFVSMTVLGTTIVKGEFIKSVMQTVPLDKIKNYCLWQPTAFFVFIANRFFKAEVITAASVFQYHESALLGSFWKRKLLYQWVERFHAILENLPTEYLSEHYAVINEWEDRYCILKVGHLLDARSGGNLSLKDVEQYRELIPCMTSTPIAYFERIASMPKMQAKWYQRHPARCIAEFNQQDHSQMAIFKKKSE